jgi:hypothetical protein
LNFKNIKFGSFAVIDWNYAAYSKVRDQEVGGSNPLAPTTLSQSGSAAIEISVLNTIAATSLSGGAKKPISVRYKIPSGNRAF